MVIDSVFAITKAPTNSAIPAKPSRNFWIIPRELLTSSTASWVCAADVFTFAVAGSSGRISETSFSGVTPSFAASWIPSSLPTFENSFCAVGMSKIAIVAEPIDELSAYVAIPVISNRRAPWSVATPIVSPSAKCFVSAVCLSIAICPPPTGHRPSASFRGLKRASFGGSTLEAMLPPPPVEMTLPSRPISCASPPTSPEAVATSGSCRTFTSTEAGKAGVSAVLLLSFLNATLPLITASEFWNEWSTIPVNAAVIVSVRTYVPLIIETPSTIASAVSAVRSLRPHSPLRETAFIGPAPRSPR